VISEGVLNLCRSPSGRFTTWFQVHWGDKLFVTCPLDFTQLITGAHLGHAVIVRLLPGAWWSLVEPDPKDNRGHTPLSWASDRGYEALVRLLLEVKAETDSRDDEGQTPLSLVAERGKETVVRLLLQVGVDVDPRDKGHRTPSLHAAYRGHKDVVRLLLEAKADPRCVYDKRDTPISAAIWRGFTKTAELLQKKV
jgi:ankyrin repeat protein